ncbi:MAG TPA: hypothetical protein VNU24_06475 [Solirubrobacteraceae bacterium]|nr:hypothetical protein [Solirubrobacteraceae bacterium]
MSTGPEERTPRLTAVMREGERVTPLELFFDLVHQGSPAPGPPP